MQLSVALYLAVSAIVQIFVGPISDKLGRRPVILWGVALFLLATLGCLYAPSAEIFLLFRMCQAIVASAMFHHLITQKITSAKASKIPAEMIVVIRPSLGWALIALLTCGRGIAEKRSSLNLFLNGRSRSGMRITGVETQSDLTQD